MNPVYAKLYLAKSIGESLGKSLAKMSIRWEEYTPRYKIEKDSITIYNFSCVDEHGYTDTSDFIELVPTRESYNLLDNKSRKISVRKCALFDKKQREIIINAIRKVRFGHVRHMFQGFQIGLPRSNLNGVGSKFRAKCLRICSH